MRKGVDREIPVGKSVIINFFGCLANVVDALSTVKFLQVRIGVQVFPAVVGNAVEKAVH